MGFDYPYIRKPVMKVTIICTNGKIITFTTDIYNKNRVIDRVKEAGLTIKEIKEDKIK